MHVFGGRTYVSLDRQQDSGKEPDSKCLTKNLAQTVKNKNEIKEVFLILDYQVLICPLSKQDLDR